MPANICKPLTNACCDRQLYLQLFDLIPKEEIITTNNSLVQFWFSKLLCFISLGHFELRYSTSYSSYVLNINNSILAFLSQEQR